MTKKMRINDSIGNEKMTLTEVFDDLYDRVLALQGNGQEEEYDDEGDYIEEDE